MPMKKKGSRSKTSRKGDAAPRAPRERLRVENAPAEATRAAPIAAAEPRKVIVTLPPSQRGHREPVKEQRLSIDELAEKMREAKAGYWPEAAGRYEAMFLGRASNERLAEEIEYARIRGQWDSVSKYAGALHGRSLPPTPWNDLQWKTHLQDELHRLRLRFTMVWRNAEGPRRERIARAERVLHALDLAFGYSWSVIAGDDDVLGRLDKIARPYVRKHDRSFDRDVERERPEAADFLRDWWATQLLGMSSFLRASEGRSRKDVDTDISASADIIAETFAGTLHDAFFIAVCDSLPESVRGALGETWRDPPPAALKPHLRRVQIAIVDLVSRDLVDRDKRSPPINFDELGEKLARHAMRAMGYPDEKSRSLFDWESKRTKPVT